MRKLLIPVIFAVVALGGCSKKSPCDELVAAACAGGESEMCGNIKRQTADADDALKAVCGQINVLLPAKGKTLSSCDTLADMVCSERGLDDCLNIRKEAAGADEKKNAVCAQFKTLIENTRKTNAEKADVERAAIAKAAEEAAAKPEVAPAPAPAETN